MHADAVEDAGKDTGAQGQTDGWREHCACPMKGKGLQPAGAGQRTRDLVPLESQGDPGQTQGFLSPSGKCREVRMSDTSPAETCSARATAPGSSAVPESLGSPSIMTKSPVTGFLFSGKGALEGFHTLLAMFLKGVKSNFQREPVLLLAPSDTALPCPRPLPSASFSLPRLSVLGPATPFRTQLSLRAPHLCPQSLRTPLEPLGHLHSAGWPGFLTCQSPLSFTYCQLRD